MKELLCEELRRIASGLSWLHKNSDANIIYDIGAKCEFYGIEDLKELGVALLQYRDKKNKLAPK